MKTSHKIVFGIIYSLIYVFLAAALINPEGTGSGIFLVPLITWGFIFIVLFLLGRLKSLRARIFFTLLMTLHYLITLLITSNIWNTPYNGNSSAYQGKSKLLADWEREPSLILFLVSWYILGQIFIWAMFYKELRKTGKVDESLISQNAGLWQN